ncbi:MAG TPA: glycosyltransferase family 4 protein [Polyangiaceae bacterium]
MRVAVVTKIFPSSLEPDSAPFNRQQLAELARTCHVQVLAAIPHFPFARFTRFPARAAHLAALPARERVHGLDVRYVRQLYLPRVGLPLAVPLYRASLAPHRRVLRSADVVLATWAYPDGCAAILEARALGKPCVVKVHGTDVNDLLRRRSVRAIAKRVLPLADAVVAVSRPLASELEALGVPRDRIHLVQNGIDASLFATTERAKARHALGLPQEERVILFVGRLEKRKGVFDLLDAFERARHRIDARLVLVGEGVDGARVREAASRGRIRVVGARPHEEVARWMAACDVLVLPSWMEGTPNVVLEALSSGRPVVATRVGGIPDVLSDDRAGILVPAHDPAALADAIVSALHREWDENVVRACGPRTWTESAAALQEVLDQVTARRDPAPSATPGAARRSSASRTPARTTARSYKERSAPRSPD